jgi:lysophospholipase L1-like esterase
MPLQISLFLRLFFLTAFGLTGNAAAASSLPKTFQLEEGSVIAFEGDSIVYGQDETNTGTRPPINGAGQRRNQTPLPEYLEHLLDYRIRVENRGFPGDRSSEGLTRWVRSQKVSLVFVMYGTNDAANFAGYPDGIIPVDRYSENLRTIVAHHQRAGEQVVIVPPAPVGVAEWDERITLYRQAARRVAAESKVDVFETSPAIADVGEKWVDQLHLSGEALRSLATSLHKHIAVRRRAEKSHAP